MSGVNNLTFLSNDKTCLIIHKDGTITVGEGFTPTEAGIAAIEAMRHHLRSVIAAEREACAKIADAYAIDMAGFTEEEAAAEKIASAIRARKDKTE